MKKALSIVVVLMMVLVFFVSCSQPAEESSAPAESSSEAASQAPDESTEAPSPTDDGEAEEAAGGVDDSEKIKVGITNCLLQNEWISAQMADFVTLTETEFTDIEIVSLLDANMDPQADLDNVKVLASQGVDVIVVTISDFNTGQEVVDAAGGIPVVFTNRGPADPAVLEAPNVCYVVSDEYTGGYMAGEYIGNLLLERGETVAKYVIFMGQLDAQNAMQRTQGNIDGLASTGIELEEVLVDTGEWGRTEPLNKTEQLIGAGKEFNCILANADEMLLGAIEALKAGGIDLDTVALGGFDGIAAGLESMAAGEIDCDIFQNGWGQGVKVMEAIRKVMAGEELEPYYDVPFELITPDNYQDYM